MGIFINGGKKSLVMIDTDNDDLHIVSVMTKEQMEYLGYVEKEKIFHQIVDTAMDMTIGDLAIFHFRFDKIVSELMSIPLVLPDICNFLLDSQTRCIISRLIYGQFKNKDAEIPILNPLLQVSSDDIIETLRMYSGYQKLGKYHQNNWNSFAWDYPIGNVTVKSGMHRDTDIGRIRCLWILDNYELTNHVANANVAYDACPYIEIAFYRNIDHDQIDQFVIERTRIHESIKRTVSKIDTDGTDCSKVEYFFKSNIKDMFPAY